MAGAGRETLDRRMIQVFGVDWKQLFVPQTPLLEIFIRGTIVYLGIFILLRLVLKREAGQLGIADVLVIVVLADAAQNAMAGGYHAITDGMLLVTVIIFWSYAINWLGFHSKTIGKFIYPPPLLLIKDGKMLFENMRRELIPPEKLKAILREHDIDDLSEVKEAYMESEGRISIVRNDQINSSSPLESTSQSSDEKGAS